MKLEALAELLVTVALMAVSLLGMTVFLGAHPLWSVRTGVIGSKRPTGRQMRVL